jgi:two-component system, sensor histidine kinase and response regulator
MPEMDGFETAARIRTLLGERRRVPIIAMTANAMSGVIEECMSAGMNGYVRKPATKAELIAAVAGAIGTAPVAESSGASTLSLMNGPHDSFDESVLDELERHIGRIKMTECAQLLFDQIPQALRSLKSSIGRNDPDGVEREAHALISPAGSLGLTAVAGIARDIADTVRGGNPSFPELAIRIELLARACDAGLERLGRRYPDARHLRRAASA